jgi:CRISPR-associated endonuclease/helicase Cas3
MKRPIEVADEIAARFSDVSAPEAIRAYFEELYLLVGEGLDQKRIVEQFEDGLLPTPSFPFASVAQEFRLIEETTRAILIPVPNETDEMEELLRQDIRNKDLMRAVQPYIVSVYEWEFKKLSETGTIMRIGSDNELFVLVNAKQYDPQTGLTLKFEGGDGYYA